MNKRITLIPSTLVSKLKQRARHKKRQSNLSHVQALDLIAKDAGFVGWKSVAAGAARYAPFERAMSGGLVAAFDSSEVPDQITTSEKMIFWPYGIDDQMARDIQKWLGGEPAEHEDDPMRRPNKEVLSETALQEWYRDVFASSQVFLIPDVPASFDLDKSLDQLAKGMFFSPQVVWFRGQFHALC